MTDAKPSIAADRLKSFVERIERLAEERRAIGGDIKDIFDEIKSAGFDGKAVREVLKRRGNKDLQGWDLLIDTYESALTGGKRAALEALKGGATAREAAEAGGIALGSTAALRGTVHENENHERSGK